MLCGTALEPCIHNLFNTGNEGIEDGVMHFGPDGKACFLVVLEPLQGGVHGGGENLSIQGAKKLGWAATLMGKEREPKNKACSFESIEVLDASKF